METETYGWDYADKQAYNNRTGAYKFRRQMAFIRQHLPGFQARLLDVAGGSGRFALPLQDAFGQIIVVDASPAALNLLQRRSSDIQTVNADFLAVSLDGTFPVILCIEALCYFADCRTVLEKVSALLEPDGLFLFTYTNPQSWRFSLRKLRRLVREEASYHDLNRVELERLLAEHQLRIETIEGMNWLPLTVNSDSPLVDVFAGLERKLTLHRWVSQSPWWLVAARKFST